MNKPSFYNTIHEDKETLRASIRNAKTQEAKITVFFQAAPDKSFTPFDVQFLGVFDNNVPITSIRRAMTNLSDKGILEKTGNQREGGYGKNNYCWKLAQPKKDYVQGDLF